MNGVTQAPQIITIDTLDQFKEQLLDSVGIRLTKNSNSLILKSNEIKDQTIANSAIFGENHSLPIELSYNDTEKGTTVKGLKNVLVTGQNNIPSAWNQTITGTFNKINKDALFIIGNGTSNLTRNNVLEVHKDGRFTVHNVSFLPINLDTLGVDGRLSYTEGGLLENNTDWESVKHHLDELDSANLITADIAKLFYEKLSNIIDFDTNNAGSWRNNLVQGLDYTGPNAENRALSVKDGQKLLAELTKYRDDARFVNIINMLNLLRKQVSYLISSLTVDKITNGKDGDSKVEYYAVGLADYALDADTPFKVDTNFNDVNTEEDTN
jgi:hypothetical protein